MALETAVASWVDQCAKLAADELQWDRDTVELPNGETLTLRVEPDPDMSIMDEQGEGVWCGQLEWSHRTNDYGWPLRPDWADGGAEILRRDRGDVLWWRPLDDCLRDREVRNAVRSTILELLEYGYSNVGVEYQGETEWLGGCDDVYPELIEDLAGQVVARVTERERDELAAMVARVVGVPV